MASPDPNDGGDPASEDEPASPNFVDNGFDATDGGEAEGAGGRAPDFTALMRDLSDQGFRVPLQAFEIFPDSVRQDIQSLVTQLLPLMEPGREEDLTRFFDDQGDRIATVFDQPGLEPNADALLAVPNPGSIKFPDEFENYATYLETLNLEPFERDYMLQSHQIAENYRQEISQALADQERIQSALESYQNRLEALNERYEEQFREQFLESIDRAGAEGRRPDVDR